MTTQLAEAVTMAETDYGAVLLHQGTGRYWRLNPTAVLVVRTLLRGGDEAEARRRVTERFDVPDAEAGADIAALLAAMREGGVLRR